MEIMATRSMQVLSKKGKMVIVSPGEEVSVPAKDAADLISTGAAIDVKNKEAVKQFLGMIASRIQKPRDVKEAISRYKKILPDYRAAIAAMDSAKAELDDIRRQIISNKQQQEEVAAAIDSSSGGDLDQLCIKDSGLKEAQKKLLKLEQLRDANMKNVYKSGDESIRIHDRNYGEIFRTEAERLLDELKDQLLVVYAAFDQYCLTKYGNKTSFAATLRYSADYLDVDQVDPDVFQKLISRLLKGLK